MMHVSNQQTDVKPKELHLPVEGVTLHQPLSTIVRRVNELVNEGQEILANISEIDPTDPEAAELRSSYQQKLNRNHVLLERWWTPLFAHLPHCYRQPPTLVLNN